MGNLGTDVSEQIGSKSEEGSEGRRLQRPGIRQAFSAQVALDLIPEGGMAADLARRRGGEGRVFPAGEQLSGGSGVAGNRLKI